VRVWQAMHMAAARCTVAGGCTPTSRIQAMLLHVVQVFVGVVCVSQLADLPTSTGKLHSLVLLALDVLLATPPALCCMDNAFVCTAASIHARINAS
jgi:hypothetical protein